MLLIFLLTLLQNKMNNMGTEKVNGRRVPNDISQMWALEDRAMAEAWANGVLDEVIPKINKELDIQFGMMIVFGTTGEVDPGSMSYEELFYNPEKYNLKQ